MWLESIGIRILLEHGDVYELFIEHVDGTLLFYLSFSSNEDSEVIGCDNQQLILIRSFDEGKVPDFDW